MEILALIHATVVKLLSRVQLFATPLTAARQAPLPMGFPRQEYWSGLPFSCPRHNGLNEEVHITSLIGIVIEVLTSR